MVRSSKNKWKTANCFATQKPESAEKKLPLLVSVLLALLCFYVFLKCTLVTRMCLTWKESFLKNVLFCTSFEITGWWGAPGHLLVHLSSLTCVACWERTALCVVPLFFSFLRPLRVFPANVLLLFYNSTSWNSPPTSHQMLH